MREIRMPASDPSFLLKALGEASGELRRALSSLRRAELLRAGTGADEGWSLAAVAIHLRDIERELLPQVEAMAVLPEPALCTIDLDALPLPGEAENVDLEEAVDEFQHLRRQFTYTLWDLEPTGWTRGGIHPYRGRITILDIARETYQHDLEHLWQVRRMAAAARPG